MDGVQLIVTSLCAFKLILSLYQSNDCEVSDYSKFNQYIQTPQKINVKILPSH